MLGDEALMLELNGNLVGDLALMMNYMQNLHDLMKNPFQTTKKEQSFIIAHME